MKDLYTFRVETVPDYKFNMNTVVYTGFCVWGGVPGAWGGTFFIGEIKNFAFFQTRKFSKNAKKSMKIL